MALMGQRGHSRQLPLAAELGVVCACAAAFLALAINGFG